MFENKIENLRLHIWHYKTLPKKQLLFTDLLLILFATFTIIKELAPVNLIFVYLIVYFISSGDMISFSNSALACTPLKLRDTISNTALIMWAKSTVIILVCLFFSVVNAVINLFEFRYEQHLIDIFKYALVSYAALKFLCTDVYYVSKKYRNLTTYVIAGVFIFICSVLDKLPLFWSFGLFIALSVVTLLFSNYLLKRLSYETIFFKEAER